MPDASLPPMPEGIIDTQRNYFRMLRRVLGACDHGKLSAQQAVIILCIGPDKLTSGQVRARGYAGTNVSYNLMKLRDMGLVKASSFNGDKRRVMNSLTPKGLELCIRLRRNLAIKEREAA